jgi:hypothetical protein
MDIVTIQKIERRITAQAVTDLLAAGFTVSVFDGEETTVKKSSNKKAIVAALMTTDEDMLRAFNADGKFVGMVYFVYGNDGWDVVNDYSISLEPFLTTTVQLWEKLEGQYA